MTIWTFSLSWEEQWTQDSNLFENLYPSYFFLRLLRSIILNSYTQSLISPFSPCLPACLVHKGRKEKTLCESQLLYTLPVYCCTDLFLRRWRWWGTHNYLWNKLFEGVIDTLEWLYMLLLMMLLKGFSSTSLRSNNRQVAKIAYQWVTE